MIYTIKQIPDKKFSDKQDLVRFIKKNTSDILLLKKSEYKTKSDCFIDKALILNNFTPQIEKSLGDIIEVKAIINTTNVIDSHLDLHMKGIWNKTVKDNPYTYQLKQHEQSFESVISNKAKNINEVMTFKDLGINSDMELDANINIFQIDKAKNPFMYEQYADGNVTQHSVGMMYVNLDIAIQDEESEKEMEYFNNAIKNAINPEIAIEHGFVWVVTEAKKREGSSVVFGSNPLTPTLYVKTFEPSKNTQKHEPTIVTQKNQVTKFFNPNLI